MKASAGSAGSWTSPWAQASKFQGHCIKGGRCFKIAEGAKTSRPCCSASQALARTKCEQKRLSKCPAVLQFTE